MNGARFSLSVTIESDWHVGAGAGIPGDVDRLVLRGADGLPFLPAKTLTGLLRDSAETVAAALDALRPAGAKGSWLDVLEGLFGGQPESHGGRRDTGRSPARVAVDPALLPAPVRAALSATSASASRVREALFSVQPGVRIDPRSGRAEDDKLFFVEEVRGGLTLAGDVTPLPEKGLEDAEHALLFAAVAGLRRLGGKRRRGGGACSATIFGLPGPAGAAGWLEWMEQHAGSLDLGTPPVAGAAAGHTAAAGAAGPAASGGWTEVALSVRAAQPLLVHAVTKGNSTESLDYVPGTLLLPLVFRRLAAAGVPVAALRQAVGRGDLVVSALCPRVAGRRGFPVPNAWFHPKDDPGLAREGGRVVNALVEKLGMGQHKAYREGWVGIGQGGEVLGYDGNGAAAYGMHNTVDDAAQRPTEAVGGVYGYRTIPAGTLLEGLLRVREDLFGQAGTDWRKLLGETFRLGRSKKDDYGNAELLEARAEASGTGTVALHGGKYLVVYLESDLLVRGPDLSYGGHPDDLLRAISAALFPNAVSGKAELKWAAPGALGGEISSAGRVRRTDSWQTAWGLPRPSLTALRAGGVFTLEVTSPEGWDPAAAARVGGEGLGDRRAEGFGRVRLNPGWLIGPVRRGAEEVVPPPARGPAGPNPAWTNADLQLLRDLELTAWRRKIVRAARRYAILEGGWLGLDPVRWKGADGRSRPSASQWGGLRSAALACRAEGPQPLQLLESWVQGIDRTPNRRNAWEADRLGKLKRLCRPDDPAARQELWRYLFPEEAQGNPEPASVEPLAWRPPASNAGLADALRPFAVRTLVGALCEAVFDAHGKAGGEG